MDDVKRTRGREEKEQPQFRRTIAPLRKGRRGGSDETQGGEGVFATPVGADRSVGHSNTGLSPVWRFTEPFEQDGA